MSKKPSAAVLAAAKRAQERMAPSEDKLEAIREQLRIARDLEIRNAELSAELKENNWKLNTLAAETLPTMFDAAGIDNLGLQAEGNLPAYDCKLAPYYSANIPVSWDEERRQKGFGWLADNGHGDIIKNTFTVELPRGSEKEANKLTALLVKTKLPFSQRQAVPAPTLTAFVKEQVEKHQTTPPLDLLGATVGKVVKLKERKEK